MTVTKDFTVADVHSSTTGEIKNPKARSFKDIMGRVKTLLTTKKAPRALKPIDDTTAHTPFPHDANALGNLRADQVPRFFGALTDPATLEDRTVPMASLTAMQDRVDPAKVEAIRGAATPGKPPVVVRMNGRNYLADGHHRATAAYLNGDASIPVKFKDLHPVDNALKREAKSDATWSIPVEIAKTDVDKCLVFGWASIVQKDGSAVVDLHGDIIDIGDLEEAVYEYALEKREAGEMHDRVTGVGKLVESMVMTLEKQRAMGIPEGSTPLGWWVGYKLQPDVFAKVKSGEYPMFSIGGGGTRQEII